MKHQYLGYMYVFAVCVRIERMNQCPELKCLLKVKEDLN